MWAHERHHPQRWVSRELLLRFRYRLVGDQLLLIGVQAFKVVGLLLKDRGHDTADRHAALEDFLCLHDTSSNILCGA